MGTLKNLLFSLLYPFLKLYVRLSFHGDWWALRARLQKRPSRLLWRACDRHFSELGSYVGRTAQIANTPCFPHGCVGVFISKDAVIGRDAVIFQQVTIGSNTLPGTKRPGSPTLGDGVYIGAGAKLIGGITVGDCCRVGANAVVYTDMPPHSVALCAPTRIVRKEHLDNTFRTTMDGKRYVNRDGYLVEEGLTAQGEPGEQNRA